MSIDKINPGNAARIRVAKDQHQSSDIIGKAIPLLEIGHENRQKR
jgi:hypothetical protein